MTLGNKISTLRKGMSMTQPMLAEKMNVSQSTVTSWENDRRNVGNDDLVKLADLFNVSTDYLLGKTTIKEPSKTKQAEITDDQVIMTFEGKPIPEEDLDLIKRLLRGKE
ncbi:MULTISPECIES: helix-turn-helix domain-containing protein [Lactobacillales]|uniref:Transcriptional regulator n=1 Tax=Latilactobacillus curvatus TaxID=28038 RepID=A0ABM7QWJ8_LATCU|nr:helix-turn-helix transcriptional regulator [Latilactobacillus curvatus]QEA48381.1 helix-turn-helix transcriptional regulator [Latilactobacillus curvatus]BCX31292.1 transcriptional regulator [Latilactobacillus curvatus]